MKIDNLSYKVAVALSIAVYLALIRTVSEPLIGNVDPYNLRILLVSCLIMAISCLAMAVMTILSRMKINSLIASVTIIVLVIIKFTFLH